MKKISWLITLLGSCTLTLFAVGGFADQNNIPATVNTVNFTTQATASDLDNAQLSLMQVEQTLQNAQLNLRNNEEQLQAINLGDNSQDDLQNDKQRILKAKIQNQVELIALNKQRESALKKTIAVFSKQLKNERKNLQNLTTVEQKQQNLQHEQLIQQEISALSKQQSYWLNQITALNKLLYDQTKLLEPTQYNIVLEKIFVADENSNLIQLKSTLLHLNNSLSNIISNISENSSVSELNEQSQALTLTTNELEQTKEIISKKIGLLQQRDLMLNQQKESNQSSAEPTIKNFINQYSELLNSTNQLLTQTNHQQEKTASLLAKALARRQVLPGFDLHQWMLLGKGLHQMLMSSKQFILSTSYDIQASFTQMDHLEKFKLYTILLLCLGSFFLIRHLCKKIQATYLNNPLNFFRQLLANGLKTVIPLLGLIIIIITSSILANLFSLPQQFNSLIFHLGNTLLIFSVAILIARIYLYETTNNHHGDDVKLYNRLFWLFSFGLIIRIFMILTDYFNVPYEVQDLFDRTFMLFVFVIAIMLLKASKVTHELIISLVKPKQHYLIRTIKLLAILIPLIILSSAVIGLIGYVTLAWTISKYEGLFLLVIASYLIARGIINDLLTFLASYIVRFRSGWILIEAFLKPVSFLIHLLLFFTSIYFLLYLYNLNNQAFMLGYLNKILYFPLITFSASIFTVDTLLKSIWVALFFYWATKWSREFCYRKLYRKIFDTGVRNSLSTFTQYGVCTLGIILTLKTLQIDLTTLTVIAGGLAVGIGFGLRDLMNNFISGFFILIERPVRCGDTVTINEYEGKVVHIGLRALTILSADNREIIVPNAEIFSKTLINWTLANDTVRCETMIKVEWLRNPQQLKQEIEQIMKQTSGVLAHPEPQALLKNMNDGLLEFEIRFYFDYPETESSTIMKSRVLFNIWERFTELGIHPPYATHRIIMDPEQLCNK